MQLKSMHKKYMEDYPLVVFDVDGTLYYQKPFRIKMALFIMKHLVKHPSSFKDILIIRKYRKVREEWLDLIDTNKISDAVHSLPLDEAQFEYVAQQMHCSKENVRECVNFYMFHAPLSLLPAFQDMRLKEIILNLQHNGNEIAIYSDYPAADKLRAFGLDIKNVYVSSDKEIDALKPDPKGLKYIMNDLNKKPSDVLMVGDRMEKDGLCAQNNSVDYLILSSKEKERIYESKF